MKSEDMKNTRELARNNDAETTEKSHAVVMVNGRGQ